LYPLAETKASIKMGDQRDLNSRGTRIRLRSSVMGDQPILTACEEAQAQASAT
jgi:hypothetical protein